MRMPQCRGGGRRLSLISLITIMTLVNCGGGEDEPTPTSPDPNKIKITTLVPAGEYASNPSWSPDGHTVAFTKDIRDTPQAGIHTVNVFVIPAAGGSHVQLSNQTDNGDAWTPAWSPDGQNIVFSAPRSGDPFYQTDRDLWIVPATGGAPIECRTLPPDWDPLHPDDYYDTLAREWSPDGSAILFDSPRQPGSQCCEWRSFLVPPSGGYPQDLAAALPGKVLSGGTWSPDGTRIACSGVTTGSEDSDIYIVPVAGGTPTLLVGTQAVEGVPDWSPDGNYIAYSSLLDGMAGVWVVPAAGGTPTKLVEVQSVYPSMPLWSPNGTYIAYTSFSSEVSRLWIVPAAGGTPTKLVEVDYQHAWNPGWSPDGTKIAFVTGSGGIAVASNFPDHGESQ